MTDENIVAEGEGAITDVSGTAFRIDRPSDVLELVGRGALCVILDEAQINPEFFDLSSGFAGEVVQKCANYGVRLAVVYDEAKPRSTHFRQFVDESNRRTRFIFVRSVEEARSKLQQ